MVGALLEEVNMYHLCIMYILSRVLHRADPNETFDSFFDFGLLYWTYFNVLTTSFQLYNEIVKVFIVIIHSMWNVESKMRIQKSFIIHSMRNVERKMQIQKSVWVTEVLK